MEYIRKNDAAAKVGYAPRHIMRLSEADKFPKPIKMGPERGAAVMFVLEEVEAWMEAHAAARPGVVPTGVGQPDALDPATSVPVTAGAKPKEKTP